MTPPRSETGDAPGASGRKRARKSTPPAQKKRAPKRKRQAHAAPPRGGVAGALKRTLLATLSGCAVFMAFPTFDLHYLLWVALVPLLIAIEGLPARSALRYGFVAGFVTNVGGFYWIDGLLREFGYFPAPVAMTLMLLMAAYQGTVFMLWAGLVAWLRGRTGLGLLAVAPATFVVTEMLVPFIFPWYLGNGLYLFSTAVQIAELTGVLGITALIVAVNVALYEVGLAILTRRRVPRLQPILVSGLLAATLVFGALRIAELEDQVKEAPKLRIGMVEADVGIWEKEARDLPREMILPTMRRNLLRHQMLSRDLAEDGAELIVWPETAFMPAGEVWAKNSDLFAIAVGDGGALFQRRGSRWVGPAPHPAYPAPPESLRRISMNDIWAADERLAVAVGQGGAATFFDGHGFRAEETGVREDLNAVLGFTDPGAEPGSPSRAARVFAVGERGAITIRDGAGVWHRQPELVHETLHAVAGVSPESIYALGAGGVTLHHDGRGWRRLAGAGFHVLAATISRDGALFAVGRGGRSARFDGRAWRPIATGVTEDLHALITTPRGALLAAGDAGVLLRLEKGRWRRRTLDITADLRDLALAPDSPPDGEMALLAVGRGGVVARIDSAGVQSEQLEGTATLKGITVFPYSPYFPLPHEVAHIRPANTPLPRAPSAEAGEQMDRETHPADRNAVQRGFDTPVLFGAVTSTPEARSPQERRRYNSAILVGDEGDVLGRYDKVFLLMFGEYIPLIEHLGRSLRQRVREALPQAGDFTPGERVELFPFGEYRLGVLICYEGILPRFTRKVTGMQPHALINLTNDAWFGKTSEPYLHLALATFRSIENRLTLVRSTNTGISAFVDPMGRITQQTSLEDPEILIEDVPMLAIDTFYRRYGDLLGYASSAWIALLIVAAMSGRRR